MKRSSNALKPGQSREGPPTLRRRGHGGSTEAETCVPRHRRQARLVAAALFLKELVACVSPGQDPCEQDVARQLRAPPVFSASPASLRFSSAFLTGLIKRLEQSSFLETTRSRCRVHPREDTTRQSHKLKLELRTPTPRTEVRATESPIYRPAVDEPESQEFLQKPVGPNLPEPQRDGQQGPQPRRTVCRNRTARMPGPLPACVKPFPGGVSLTPRIGRSLVDPDCQISCRAAPWSAFCNFRFSLETVQEVS